MKSLELQFVFSMLLNEQNVERKDIKVVNF